jgi:hypothetical protein
MKVDRDFPQKLIQPNRGIGYTFTCTDDLSSTPLYRADLPVQHLSA